MEKDCLATFPKTWTAMIRHSPPSVMAGHTKLGVLRLDYNFTPTPGDMAHPSSYSTDTIFRAVPGFTFEMCKTGKITNDVHNELVEAIAWLEDRNVSAITGDCGFMVFYQELVKEYSRVPVFMSSLTQLPSINCVIQQNRKICILTSDLTTLKTTKHLILETVGGHVEEDRLLMVTCENLPGFEAVSKEENVATHILEPGVVSLALATIQENPSIGCFLFECTQLAAFSNAVRQATGVPVYDAITACDFFTSAFQEYQRFGKTNWKNKWSGQVREYKIGQELDEEKRDKLVSIRWKN